MFNENKGLIDLIYLSQRASLYKFGESDKASTRIINKLNNQRRRKKLRLHPIQVQSPSKKNNFVLSLYVYGLLLNFKNNKKALDIVYQWLRPGGELDVNLFCGLTEKIKMEKENVDPQSVLFQICESPINDEGMYNKNKGKTANPKRQFLPYPRINKKRRIENDESSWASLYRSNMKKSLCASARVNKCSIKFIEFDDAQIIALSRNFSRGYRNNPDNILQRIYFKLENFLTYIEACSSV